jgi:hypothetical protein
MAVGRNSEEEVLVRVTTQHDPAEVNGGRTREQVHVPRPRRARRARREDRTLGAVLLHSLGRGLADLFKTGSIVHGLPREGASGRSVQAFRHLPEALQVVPKSRAVDAQPAGEFRPRGNLLIGLGVVREFLKQALEPRPSPLLEVQRPDGFADPPEQEFEALSVLITRVGPDYPD